MMALASVGRRSVHQVRLLSSVLVCLVAMALVPDWTAAQAAVPADAIPPKPSRYINDFARVLDPANANALNESLAAFERTNSSQILVAIFPQLPAGAALEDFTVRTAQAWGVGQKATGNGVILFVFVQDRALRIEVGYGLEGAIPDALARRIIDNELTPSFRGGDYNRGIRAGVQALMLAARGEYRGTGRTVAESRNGNRGRLIVPFLFLLFLFTASVGWELPTTAVDAPTGAVDGAADSQAEAEGVAGDFPDSPVEGAALAAEAPVDAGDHFSFPSHRRSRPVPV